MTRPDDAAAMDDEWGVPRDPERFDPVWHALTHDAVLADRSARRRLTFTGPKAGEALTGLVTNDVESLQPGQGQYAAALTPKGKVLADLRILRRDDDLLCDVSAAAGEGFAAMLRKYVNPRLARVEDVSAPLRVLGVYGPRGVDVVADALGVPGTAVDALADWGHAAFDSRVGPVRVCRVPDVGIPALEVQVPASHAAAAAAALQAAGAMPATAEPLEAARILAGWPRWGVDMDESTLTQEAGLDTLGAVSYTKGCYTGQETVARLHFRGHVNRQLRGLSAEGLVPRGARLETMDGTAVGDVRSTAEIPRVGTVALAMVRREIEVGGTVTARWDGHAMAARVTSLPFPGD